jgi:hypothetical protein
VAFYRKKRSKLCYLCAKPGADTKEHIPARGIFPKEPAGRLITVPAHRRCNERFSEDDDLFRNLVIAASWKTPEGQKAWNEQVLSSWKKNPGAKRELQKRLLAIWVKDPVSGALIRKPALAADVSLFRRQVDRWMRGLFYHRFREPMPVDIKIQVDKLDKPEISLPPLKNIMVSQGARPNWVHVEPKIFSYLHVAADENKHASVGIFVFFDTEVYMASTNVGRALT